jgi:hypothetical protein
MCEKPLAPTLLKAQQCVDALREHGLLAQPLPAPKIRYEHRADIQLAFLQLGVPSSPCVSSGTTANSRETRGIATGRGDFSG